MLIYDPLYGAFEVPKFLERQKFVVSWVFAC
jgi:hypothetical protein